MVWFVVTLNFTQFRSFRNTTSTQRSIPWSGFSSAFSIGFPSLWPSGIGIRTNYNEPNAITSLNCTDCGTVFSWTVKSYWLEWAILYSSFTKVKLDHSNADELIWLDLSMVRIPFAEGYGSPYRVPANRAGEGLRIPRRPGHQCIAAIHPRIKVSLLFNLWSHLRSQQKQKAFDAITKRGPKALWTAVETFRTYTTSRSAQFIVERRPEYCRKYYLKAKRFNIFSANVADMQWSWKCIGLRKVLIVLFFNLHSVIACLFNEFSADPIKLERSISIYDNVDITESIEAAKRLSAIEASPSRPNSGLSAHMSTHSQDTSNVSKVSQEIKEVSKDLVESIKAIDEKELSSALRQTKETDFIESIASEDCEIKSDYQNNVLDQLESISGHFDPSLDQPLGPTHDPNPRPHSPHLSSKTVVRTETKSEIFRESSVELMKERLATKTITSSSVCENSTSIVTNNEKQILLQNKEILRFESKAETNGEFGSRTSPLRTAYKRGSDKSQPMVATGLSPTSPTKPSLIPRYVANTLNSNQVSVDSPVRPQTRTNSNSSPINSAFARSKSSGDETKLRIFVPYSHSDQHNDNRIQLRVDSPIDGRLQTKTSKQTKQTKQLNNDSIDAIDSKHSKCLPAVDT